MAEGGESTCQKGNLCSTFRQIKWGQRSLSTSHIGCCLTAFSSRQFLYKSGIFYDRIVWSPLCSYHMVKKIRILIYFSCPGIAQSLRGTKVQKPWPSQRVIAWKILRRIIQVILDAPKVSAVSFQRNETAFLLIISCTREWWLWNWICMHHLNWRLRGLLN